MKVLVTGGAGYIGSIAVEQLIKAGEEVVVFDNLYQGHQQAVHPKAAFVQGDLADRAAIDAVMVERYARAKGSLYRERRQALELELQAAWFERLPMLPLVLTSRLAAVREGLEGPDWGQADSLFWNVAEWRFAEPR